MKLRIKELREENALTQKELAIRLNNAQRNVSNWEAGTTEPDCSTIAAIADIFGVSIDELFGRDYYFERENSAVPSELIRLIGKLTAEQTSLLIKLIQAFTDR